VQLSGPEHQWFMRRLSRIMICLALPTLSQCGSSRLRTAIENETGQAVNLRIEMKNGAVAMQAELLAGQTLSISERTERLSRIVYGYGQVRCQLQNAQIKQAIAGDLYGRPLVVLRPCLN
jgi:hypothetical protein